MKHGRLPLGLLLASSLLRGVSSAGLVQERSDLEASTERVGHQADAPNETEHTVLQGRVLMPDGRPSHGAVVVSSAGGKSVTDAEGFFDLELEVARDVQEVRVTAVRAGSTANLLARSAIPLLSRGGTIPTGTLVLQHGASCDPNWLPTFGSEPGVNSDATGAVVDVRALTVYDDGSGGGPALYAGGSFTTAGSVAANYIARWDGSSWSPLGSGMSDIGSFTAVLALTVYDDGSGGGPALYAGGRFTSAGGVPANHIARWDGSSWSPLGSGISGIRVHTLTVHDDGSGSGPALYAGGDFTAAGGVPANRIAKWNGASWSALGGGVNNRVVALTVYDDGVGGGPALYAGGAFTTAGGVAANYVARWDGASWSPLGSGVNGGVTALTVYDDNSGGGPALYAGGAFTAAGGGAANRIARWDGSAWSPLGSGMNDSVSALTVYDDGSGSGPALYAGGHFTSAGGVLANRSARWDGSLWSALGSGMNDEVKELAVYDDGSGSGPALYAGGAFTTAGGIAPNRIARWDGASWSPLGTGISGTTIFTAVFALTVHDDNSGGGPALYAGGSFTTASGVAVNGIARWDGSSWSQLGSGMNSPVYSLTPYDDGSGSGPELYAGGLFTVAGDVTVNRIARWDGSAWSPLGSGMNPGVVSALTVYDDNSGGGPALYAGGAFTAAGGVAANRIARWDGSAWSPLGSGMNDSVSALTVYDDGSGSGPALYAGGAFTAAGGVAANRIARWDGSTWSPLGSGMNDEVRALTVYDDGSGGGPALYAGGDFTSPAGRIASWDGSSWSPHGSGMNDEVWALTVYDDGSGSGPALYAGGEFTSAGGVAANRIASWDGSSWSPLGSGVSGGIVSSLGVYALIVHEDGSGSGAALCAGGSFWVSPAGDSHVAKWGGCVPAGVGAPYCFGDGSGGVCPCGNSGGPEQGCANSSGSGAVLTAGGSSSVGADDLTFEGTNLLPNQPALLFAGHNAVNNGDGLPFGDGLRCAGGSVVRLGVQVPDSNGDASWGAGLAGSGGWMAGDVRRFQVWYRDPTGSPCASLFNLSNGYEVTFTN